MGEKRISVDLTGSLLAALEEGYEVLRKDDEVILKPKTFQDYCRLRLSEAETEVRRRRA